MDGSGVPIMTTRIAPAEDQRGFRNALGSFATGVTVVTALSPRGRPVGITANSFASVSLDPPLVLWSPAKTSTRYDVYVAVEDFVIHVLADNQRDISNGFAKDWAAFDAIDWTPNAHGTPLIEGCLARFQCKTYARHDGGDHTIVVGEVYDCDVANPQPAEGPLIFASGQYGRFTQG